MRDEEIRVTSGPVSVAGRLTVPEGPKGVVLFAHGSGSSRHSPRNRYVAEVLNAAGFATVLLDLLTPAEERNRANVFDIGHAGAPIGRRHGLAGRPTRHGILAGRVLRRQHRSRRGSGRGRASQRAGGGGGIPRRSPRSCGRGAARRARPDLVDRWRTRRDGPWPQSSGTSDDPGRLSGRRGARGHTPFRGTGRARAGSRAGARLVHRPPGSPGWLG